MDRPTSDRPLSARLQTGLQWWIRAEQILAVGLLAGILGLMAAQVVARYLLGTPIAWTEEVARFALVWLAFLAAAFVMGEGRHIAVDLVPARLKDRGEPFFRVVGCAAIVTTVSFLLPPGLDFVRGMARVSSPAFDIPMSWWYLSAWVGLALIALHSLVDLLLYFLGGLPHSKGPLQADESPQAFETS